ncbi:hypothetical protein SGLAM104S_02865 [Streptomyces glaucescens]
MLLGITGHPPKTYRIPVPDPAGGPPTVLVYRRVSRGQGRLTQRWKYVHDPGGEPGGGGPEVAVVEPGAARRSRRHAGRQPGRRRRVTRYAIPSTPGERPARRRRMLAVRRGDSAPHRR